jgi:predicted component of type VI protein secretion system
LKQLSEPARSVVRSASGGAEALARAMRSVAKTTIRMMSLQRFWVVSEQEGRLDDGNDDMSNLLAGYVVIGS